MPPQRPPHGRTRRTTRHLVTQHKLPGLLTAHHAHDRSVSSPRPATRPGPISRTGEDRGGRDTTGRDSRTLQGPFVRGPPPHTRDLDLPEIATCADRVSFSFRVSGDLYGERGLSVHSWATTGFLAGYARCSTDMPGSVSPGVRMDGLSRCGGGLIQLLPPAGDVVSSGTSAGLARCGWIRSQRLPYRSRKIATVP